MKSKGSSQSAVSTDRQSDTLTVEIISFGYKQGNPPSANMVYDVRFLKNPFWVEELRPLTGRDKPVQDYVLTQQLAQDFLKSIGDLVISLVPRALEMKLESFSVAFGCTGGQHRSVTMVEALAKRLEQSGLSCKILRLHRELDKQKDAEPDCEPVS